MMEVPAMRRVVDAVNNAVATRAGNALNSLCGLALFCGLVRVFMLSSGCPR